MQHTWRKLAGLAFGGVVRPWPTTLPLRKPISRISSKASPLSHCFQTIFTSASLQNAPSTSSISEGSSDLQELDPTQSDSELSPAAQGRAAASAVRELMQAENVADAFFIVNSVRYANFPEAPSNLFGIDSMEQFHSVALAFTPDVSPRLPSHSLLHGLIRLGMVGKASSLADQMMATGIRVRCKTLEVLYVALSQASQAESGGMPKPLLTHAALKSPNILKLDPSSATDKRTEFAIRLLGLARKSRQRRSHNMYRLLVTLCVINGEIILASLIFGVLLRDWQARRLKTIDARETPEPTQNHMIEICRLANEHLSSEANNNRANLQSQSALQALAILANLLDRRLIRFPDVASLIHALYHCPWTSEEVWIPGDDGTPRRVQANGYFQEVLERLIDSLWENTFHGPPPSIYTRPIRRDDAIALDLPSCNSLLAYALHHRQSIPHAQKVWRYMFDMRFKPSSHTHSIFARVGKKMDDSMQVSDLNVMIHPEMLSQIAKDGDQHTLAIHIKRAIALGKPETVVAALPLLLPGFQFELGSMSAHTVRRHRRKCIAQLTHLGPVLFGSILDALHKTREIRLAEKLWGWARVAEHSSWKPDAEGVVTPWCIPVHMYTTMIQIYSDKARKEIPLQNALSESPSESSGGRSARGKAIKLYRRLWTEAKLVESRLAALEEKGVEINIRNKYLDALRPDARFFNATLHAIGRRQPRRDIERNPGYYRRGIRIALKKYLESGRPPPAPQPELLEIVTDMAAEGFSIPWVYRRSLIGRTNIDINNFGASNQAGICFVPVLNTKSEGRRAFLCQDFKATKNVRQTEALAG